ncbi:NAD(P)H-dependent glycerol-3-phosphate dehydrogenase [Chloroflexota bacterium]
MPKIAIIGTTTWGITMGVVLANKKMQVRLWARTEKEAKIFSDKGPNKSLMPGISFPHQISFTYQMEEALAGARAVILAVPSQTMRDNIQLVKDHLNGSTLVISASKGLELGTYKRMSQVIADTIDARFHHNICILSGPNLYREVLSNAPAATVIAAESEKVARKAQRLLNAPNFCVYTNTDVIGVEIGGATKNIIALGAGMIDGLQYGDNAKSAFITRGLTEITALGVSLGASPLTFLGLAGLGDLIATCASPLSRNHYVGIELTKGRSLEEITNSMNGVAEGVATTHAVWNLAKAIGLEMPITEKIYQVLNQEIAPGRAAAELMAAQTRHELTGRKWKLFSFIRRQRHA